MDLRMSCIRSVAYPRNGELRFAGAHRKPMRRRGTTTRRHLMGYGGSESSAPWGQQTALQFPTHSRIPKPCWNGPVFTNEASKAWERLQSTPGRIPGRREDAPRAPTFGNSSVHFEITVSACHGPLRGCHKADQYQAETSVHDAPSRELVIRS